MRQFLRNRWLMIVPPLLVVLVTVCVCQYAIYLTNANAEAHAYRVAMDSAEEQIQTLNVALDGRFTMLEAYALAVGLDGDFRLDSPLVDALMHTKRGDEHAFTLTFVDASGACLSADGRTANVADRWYFAQAMAGQHAIERVEDGRFHGEPRFLLAVPIWQNETVVGLAVGAYNEIAFRDLLSFEGYGGEGFSYVCDAEGRLVVGPERNKASLPDNVFASITDAGVRKGDSPARIAENLNAGGSGSVLYQTDGVERFAAYRPTGVNDWTLFNVVPGSTIRKTVAKTNQSVYQIALLAMLFVLAMLLFVFWVQWRGQRELKRECKDFRAAATQSGRMLRIYDVKGNRLVNTYREDSIVWRPTPQQMVDDGLVAPGSAAAYLAFYEGMRAGQETGSADCQVVNTAGELRWYHGDYTLLRDWRGQPDHTVVTLYDNTEHMERELEYRQWSQTLDGVAAQAAVCQVISLTQNRIERELGDPYYRIGDRADRTYDAYQQYTLEHFVYPDDVARCREFLGRERLLVLFFSGVAEDNLELRLLGEDGQPRWFRATANMSSTPDRQEIKLFLSYFDIDKEKTEQLRLLDLAQRDSMTGLLNRAALHDGIVARLQACPPDRLVAMLMIDLDNFKNINDTFGHQRGDAVISAAGNVIAGVFRAEDLVGRVGGDEFMAFVMGATPDVLRARAESLCAAARFTVDGVTLGASVGCCVLRAGKATYERLYQLSDAALYRAKSDCRGRYYIDLGNEKG